MGILSTLKSSFDSSISPRLWAFFFILFVLLFVSSYIAQLITIDVAVLVLAGSFSPGSFESPLELFSNPVVLSGMAFAVLLYALIVSFVGVIFHGIQLNGARSFLSGMAGITLLLKNSWQQTKPRILPAFAVNVIIGFLSLIVMCILFLPAILAGISLLSGNTATLPGLILWAVLGIVIVFALFFLLSPFFYLLFPVVYFEKFGAMASIARAFSLSRQNYIRNLLYVFLSWLIIFGSFLVLAALFWFGIFLLIIPVIGWVLGFLLLLAAIVFLFVLVLWMQPFSTIVMVKLYEMAFPGSVPVQSSQKKQSVNSYVLPSQPKRPVGKIPKRTGKSYRIK